MFSRMVVCVGFACSLTFVESVGAQTATEVPLSDAALGIAATLPAPEPAEVRRPAALVPLYASLIALQAADAVTTVTALQRHNARELNPVMRPFADHRAALLAVKGASTAVTLFAAERLWKRNRVAAVLTMLGINAAYGAIVANNVRALRR